MKTSLTQAWEATGFTGYALRGKVEVELGNRFHKENPDVAQAWGKVVSGVFGMLVTFGLFWAWMQIIVAVLPSGIDLSKSVLLLLFICALVLPSISTVIVATLFYLSVGKNLQKAIKMPNVYRYVFQHRDDEVEL